MSEIERILRNGLARLINEKGLERFAPRVYGILGALVKRVDLETYGTFSAIVLNEGPEFEDAFSDVSLEDKSLLRELAIQFFEVTTLYCTTDGRHSKITKHPVKR
jgi:hypothetical protein